MLRIVIQVCQIQAMREDDGHWTYFTKFSAYCVVK